MGTAVADAFGDGIRRRPCGRAHTAHSSVTPLPTACTPLPERGRPSTSIRDGNRTPRLIGHGSTDLFDSFDLLGTSTPRSIIRPDVLSPWNLRTQTLTDGRDRIAAAKTGAEWAWEQLYSELSGPLTGYLRAGGARDPEDLASEVFLQVARDISRFDGDESNFRSWVFVIAHRRLIDARRSVSRRPETVGGISDDREPPGGDVEEEAMELLSVGRIAELLDLLTEDQRDVLTLRLIGDLSLEETAATMGKRVGAIKALQRRALSNLKTMLEDEQVSL